MKFRSIHVVQAPAKTELAALVIQLLAYSAAHVQVDSLE